MHLPNDRTARISAFVVRIVVGPLEVESLSWKVRRTSARSIVSARHFVAARPIWEQRSDRGLLVTVGRPVRSTALDLPFESAIRALADSPTGVTSTDGTRWGRGEGVELLRAGSGVGNTGGTPDDPVFASTRAGCAGLPHHASRDCSLSRPDAAHQTTRFRSPR